MHRSRDVEQSGNCHGALKELRECQVAVCEPEDCEWGEWNFWSSCSKSCGSGVQRRHREVKTVARRPNIETLNLSYTELLRRAFKSFKNEI